MFDFTLFYENYGISQRHGELDALHTFLDKTDHIPNKIIEAQVLGASTKDYTDILLARKEARIRINELKGENNE